MVRSIDGLFVWAFVCVSFELIWVCVCEQKFHSYSCYFFGFLHFFSFFFGYYIFYFTLLQIYLFSLSLFIFIFLSVSWLFFSYYYFFFNINAFVLYFFVFFSWILFCKNDFCVWRSKPLHLFRSVAVGSLQLKLCLSFLYNQSYICMQCYGLIL